MGFENDIVFDDAHNSLLVIEDNALYAKIAFDLYKVINEKDKGNEVVLLDNKENNILHTVILINDPLSLDFNNKSILTGLYNMLESNILSDPELDFKFKDYLMKMNKIILDEAQLINLEFDFSDEITVSQYLKAISFKISKNECNTISGILETYFEIISEIIPDKPIIMYNSLSYLNEEDLRELLKYKNYKHLNVLFIEHADRAEFNDEAYKYFIDQDYCEFTNKNTDQND